MSRTTSSTPLTPRQQAILKAVVAEHVRSATPVGSRDLVEQYDFGVSPATIRNEMLALEEAGLLEQPHTSAGRVPTDLGYRTYVRASLQGDAGLVRRRAQLERRLDRIQEHYQALARETALLLAELTEQGAITSTGERAERAGLAHLIDLPELKDNDIARAVARAFDHPEEVLAHVARQRSKPALQVAVPGGAPVQVYIGADAGFGRLPLSVLVSAFPCGAGGRTTGHLVVIGPTRMSYSRNVAALSYLSGLLARHVRSSGKYLALVALLLPTGIVIHQINSLSL